jgi:hypothetical protein
VTIVTGARAADADPVNGCGVPFTPHQPGGATMRASLAIGFSLFVGTAALADGPADAPPPMLAAGDALGLAIFTDLAAEQASAPAPVREPAPPAAQAEE